MRTTSSFLRTSASAFVLLLVAGLFGCGDEPTGPDTSATATRIDKVAGAGQQGVVGEALAEDISVRLSNQDGIPVSGVPVVFEIGSGGGAVSPASTETDGEGLARAEWTLGTDASALQQLTARVPSGGEEEGSSLEVIFTAAAVAGPAAELEKTSGDDQIVPAELKALKPLVVTVRDAFGNPVADTEITWATSEEDGAVIPAVSTSGEDGQAETQRRAGSTTGLQETTATGDDLGSVAFKVTVVEKSDLDPASVEIYGGDDQTAPVGTAPATPYSVRVLDPDGHPVEGAYVQWEVGEGGGRVKPENSQTTPDGVAVTTRQYGEAPGDQTTIARVLGLPGDSVVIQGTAVAAEAAEILLVSGDDQTGMTGTELADSLRVRVVDDFGNPVPDINVQWDVADGGGSLSSDVTLTATDGEAAVAWTLGDQEGEQAAEARVDGLAGSPVVFTATATNEPPSDIQSVSGDGQAGASGETIDPYVVEVVDEEGAPLQGITVQWRIADGDGGSISQSETSTNESGEAQTTPTLPSTVGATQTVIAEAAGLADDSVVFTSTVTENASGVTSLSAVSGETQNGTAGQAADEPFVVQATDDEGDPVSGATVEWSVVSSSGGSVDSTSTTTDASGEAAMTATLPGSQGDTLRVEATVAGVSDTIEFVAVASTSGAVDTLVQVSGNGQDGSVEETLPEPYIVRALDENGDPLVDVTIDFEPVDPSTDGSVSPESVPTDGGGYAQTTHTLGSTIGTHEVRATGDAEEVIFVANVVGPDGEAEVVKISGDGQNGAAGEPLPDPYVVEVRDASGVPVPDVTVYWEKQSGDGGSINTSETVTDSDGQAEVTATMPQTTGETQTVFATADALSDTISFTSTSTNATAPANISVLSGNEQTDRVRQVLEDSLYVVVTDSNSAVVEGAEVEWDLVSVPAGATSGELSTDRNTTDEDGEAGIWFRLGDESGDYEIEATVGGVTQIATFTETAVGDPDQMILESGDLQDAAPGETFDDPLIVRVEDADGVGVPNVEVEWSVTTGDGGGVSPTSSGPFEDPVTVITNSQGQALVYRRVGADANAGDSADTQASLPNFPGVAPVDFAGSAQ